MYQTYMVRRWKCSFYIEIKISCLAYGFSLTIYISFVGLRIEPRASHVVGKCCSAELHPQPSLVYFQHKRKGFLFPFFSLCV